MLAGMGPDSPLRGRAPIGSTVGLVLPGGGARAAYQVGYESPSQFSREYARMFGAPPRRDITGFRAAAS